MRIRILIALLILTNAVAAQELKIWFDHDVDVAFQYYHRKTDSPYTPSGKKMPLEVIFRGQSKELGRFEAKFATPCEFIVASPERFRINLVGEFPEDAVVQFNWKPGNYTVSFDPWIGVVVSRDTF